MRYLKYIIISLLVLSFASCKKKYDKDMLGPEITTSFELAEPFVLNFKKVDFAGNDSNFLTFAARFTSPVKWKITIKGSQSCAQKDFRGFSNAIKDLVWYGSQDSLYYFRSNEECTVTLSVDNGFRKDYISDNLENRGDILASDKIVAIEKITIKSKRKTPKGQFEVFPLYESTSPDLRDILPTKREYEAFLSNGNVGYDQENVNPMLDSDVPFINSNTPRLIFNESSYVPLSCNGGLRSNDFYMIKGTDRTSMVDVGFPDYYIGRMASVILSDETNIQYVFNTERVIDSIKTVPADSLYFNVFVYGNGDGSLINYTIKEDEDANGVYQDEWDESYQYSIKVDFMGWKLFSYKYSDFVYTQYKNQVPKPDPKHGQLTDGKKANKLREPGKIVQIQFGLVGPSLGGSGRAIIDNPVISWNGKLKY